MIGVKDVLSDIKQRDFKEFDDMVKILFVCHGTPVLL